MIKYHKIFDNNLLIVGSHNFPRCAPNIQVQPQPSLVGLIPEGTINLQPSFAKVLTVKTTL
jgi:hypothetical protein